MPCRARVPPETLSGSPSVLRNQADLIPLMLIIRNFCPIMSAAMKRSNVVLAALALIALHGLAASPFNSNLRSDEAALLDGGEILIRNINYARNMCLERGISLSGNRLIDTMEGLSPKYLAEVIQIKSYEGNEDLPDRLAAVLDNIPAYAGIPYFSERGQRYYDLYSRAEIVERKVRGNRTDMTAMLEMEPFGTVEESITLERDADSVLYTAMNMNKLRYLDKFDCIAPEKMKICIFLFRDGDRWILYGAGGVNAPRIPFFTERIQTSFINRIKTFCNFIFEQF